MKPVVVGFLYTLNEMVTSKKLTLLFISSSLVNVIVGVIVLNESSTSWIFVLLKVLTASQLSRNSQKSYVTQRFITIFLITCHWSLSSAQRIQSTPCYPSPYLFNIILSCIGRTSKQSLPFQFSHPKTMYTFLCSPTSAT